MCVQIFLASPTSALVLLGAPSCPKNGEFQKRTIIVVTDSHTTGIASARTFIILPQLANIYDRTVRKPARFNFIPVLQTGALEYSDPSERSD